MPEPTHEVTMTFTLAEKDAKRLLGTVNNKDFRIHTLTFNTPWRDVVAFAPISLNSWEVTPTQENPCAEIPDSGLDEKSREINALAEALHAEDGSQWYKVSRYLPMAQSLHRAGVRAHDSLSDRHKAPLVRTDKTTTREYYEADHVHTESGQCLKNRFGPRCMIGQEES